jgi:pimeloyl-ACP methyl ester carboxylesterase
MTRSRDGVELAYATHTARGAGTGPAVVLVHGWLGNRTYWDAQVDSLTERHDVITLDLGGHGESGAGRTDWNLQAFGDDVVAVVEDVDPEQVVLVGHSMGGDAVLFAARQLGDRVAGLVWVDAFRSLGHEQPAPPEAIEAFVAPFREDFDGAIDQFVGRLLPAEADPALAERVAADMKAARREVALGSIGYALNREPAVLAALADLKAPVVALNPADFSADEESLRRYGVEPILLEAVGHFPMLEDAAQLNRVLAKTLASFMGTRPGAVRP